MGKMLRHGFTTGACACAAAKGAALMLARQEALNETAILLPAGETAIFRLHGHFLSSDSAACFVIKDAGDDPDVTNGAEIHARVTFSPTESDAGEAGDVVITGGTGIGRATKPGLAVAPGEWAINPVPRSMITAAVREVFPGKTVQVEIWIPDGELRALKTLNARLGIIGGLSILGTTGIVRPISAKAWTDTIDAALDVARACNCPTVLLSTGRTSELAAQRHHAKTDLPGTWLPEEACIMMGDHIAYALKACRQRGYEHPLIACQFAKLLKIACGYENTHAAASELDLATLRQWAVHDQLPACLSDLMNNANTAREIVLAADYSPILLKMVCSRARDAVRAHAPGMDATFLVADYTGTIIFSS